MSVTRPIFIFLPPLVVADVVPPELDDLPPPPAPSAGGIESYKRLADVFHQLLAEQELDTLLEQVAATLGDIVPYDTLTVYQTEEPARELVAVYARDRWADQILGSRLAFREGVTRLGTPQPAPR